VGERIALFNHGNNNKLPPMKSTILSLLAILACTTKGMAAPSFSLQLSIGSGSKLHYTDQETFILKKDGRRISRAESHQDYIQVDHCNPNSCTYSVTRDGTRLNTEFVVAHNGTILSVLSANESEYNVGYALGTLAKKFIMFHGIEFEPGKVRACGIKWGDGVGLSIALKSAFSELMTARCMLVKTESVGAFDYVVINYEQTLREVVGNADAISRGEITFDRTTGILIKDEDRIIGQNLLPPIEAFESTETSQLNSQRSVIKDPASALRVPQGQRP
jgi:hypothetical protein